MLSPQLVEHGPQQHIPLFVFGIDPQGLLQDLQGAFQVLAFDLRAGPSTPGLDIARIEGDGFLVRLGSRAVTAPLAVEISQGLVRLGVVGIELDSAYTKAYKALGDLHRQGRSYGPAAQAYQKAIAIDSSYAEAWGGLARTQVESQDLEGALKTLSRAVKVDAKYEEGYVLLGAVLNQLNRQQEAIEPLRQAVDLNTKDPEAHFRLAEAYYALGDYTNAQSAAQSALQRQQDYPPAEVVLADTYVKLGQPDQARPWYQRALTDSRFKEYCANQLEELAAKPKSK